MRENDALEKPQGTVMYGAASWIDEARKSQAERYPELEIEKTRAGLR